MYNIHYRYLDRPTVEGYWMIHTGTILSLSPFLFPFYIRHLNLAVTTVLLGVPDFN